jgi:hypothetical protein
MGALANNPESVQEVANAPMPAQGFTHPWQSLPADVWEEIHRRYSHFGCLQEEVSWRSQYYRVNLKPGTIPAGISEDEVIEESSNELAIRQACLDWSDVNEAVGSIQGVVDTLSNWAKEIEEFLAKVEEQLRIVELTIRKFKESVEKAWEETFEAIQRLLGELGGTRHSDTRSANRSEARSAVKRIVFREANSALRGLPLYSDWPREVRDAARDAVDSVVDEVLNHELFDGLWAAIGGVARQAEDLMEDVRKIDPDRNLTLQLRNLILDRVEEAVRDVFGRKDPKIRLAIRVKVDWLLFDERIDLGTIVIPLSQMIEAVRDAIGALGVIETGLRQLVEHVSSALDYAAKRVAQEVKRAEMIARRQALTSMAAAREHIQETLDNAISGSTFVRTVHRRPLFHDRFRFKLLHRPPLGYILVHWDKRDDDLLPFNEMKEDTPKATPITLRRRNGSEFPAIVHTWQRVTSPPVVFKAEVAVRRDTRGNATSAMIRIFTLLDGNALDESIWRVRIGALPRIDDRFGAAEVFFDVLRHERFTRQSPATHAYEWQLANESAALREQVSRYCSAEGRQRFGTSVWFENIVGHVSTPDELTFA